ncbi:hypothetical protein PTSG_12337 [Salpingoeca rosetta]|uniref:Aminotransferase class I/classII large domain-containing protein n=1 Tax=Salpingoeca rosetta (strain ATCC 50818 / BSB-021) TaxID=946362 RepID=F2UBJ1_SALR5|nr:uncharacterized protein PTSG_12337 [Salpingoeca rosetta]EGD73857.1 hypothetical protein PTSG_12337 [Salpingoeca rosetta]|eukprot:XP_004993420.1 hypothetical protein PTSG_12337 [Salpingoeca rosetta]
MAAKATAQALVPRLRPFLSRTILSPTLASNELVNAHPNKDKLLHLGFGQSPFPVHPSLTQAIDAFQHNQYEHTSGTESLRKSIASFYERKHGLDLSNYDVIVTPGSKLGLFALQAAIEGPTLLPVPSWVSYEPQMHLLGLSAVKFKALLSDEGMRLDPQAMAAAIEEHVAAGGAAPTKMIINSPNNPTGLVISNPHEIAQFAAENNIAVISDEIYDGVTPNGAWSTFGARYEMMMKPSTRPTNTVSPTGLSKVFSLGGWRVGVLLVPKSMQGAFSGVLRSAGIDCPRHQGSFYLYPNFDKFREALKQQRGIETSDDLARALVMDRNLVTLPATAFGDNETLSLRLALCDYDGGKMLERYVRDGRQLSDAALEEVAPRIHAAAHALANFASSL